MGYPLLTGTTATSSVKVAVVEPNARATGPRAWTPLPTYERSSSIYLWEMENVAAGASGG